MEPFENSGLTDHELDGVLREWKAPGAPARLRAAVFGPPKPWWRVLWGVSIRIPLPVACVLVLLAIAGLWVSRKAQPVAVQPSPAPQVIVETKTVEVPVVKERVIYRDRAPEATAWRPVAELRPRIVKGGQREN